MYTGSIIQMTLAGSEPHLESFEEAVKFQASLDKIVNFVLGLISLPLSPGELLFEVRFS